MVDFTEIAVQLIAGSFSIAGIMVTYLTSKAMRKNKEKTTSTNYPKLTTHPVHVNIDEHILNSKQIRMNIVVNEGRKKLAQDFLQYVITCWKEPCMDFANAAQKCIDNCNTNCNECNKIYTLAMRMFSEGRVSVEQLKKININPEDYDAIIIFRDKFIEWDRIRLERLARKISDIALINDTYKDCSVKSARILEAIDDYIFDIAVNGICVLTTIDYELDNKHYKFHEL